MSEPLVFAESGEDDFDVEGALRPTTLGEFIGQDRVKSQLGLVLEATNRRGGVCDHVLLSGPPGLGKTTLATVVLLMETTKAIKLKDITNPPNKAGKPASFKILIVFFL